MSKRGRPPKKIEWGLVLFWMEQGYPAGEVAREFAELTLKQFSARAKAELTMKEWMAYKEMALANRIGYKVVCGTQGGYEKHRRAKKKDPSHQICQPCRTAHHEYMQRYKEKKPVPEYKVNYKGRVKRYGRECWVVERHNPTKGIRHIATYIDKDEASAVATMLNERAGYEVG